MAQIIDLDFYRKFRVVLPIRQLEEEIEKEMTKPVRRQRKHRKTISRPLYRNHNHTADK